MTSWANDLQGPGGALVYSECECVCVCVCVYLHCWGKKKKTGVKLVLIKLLYFGFV